MGINLRFSDNVVEWNGQELDFRPDDLEDGIYAVANIPDPISVEESIYDDAMQPSTYKAATTKDILPTLPHLTDEQKTILGKMLDQFDDLFDGTLGKWKGSDYKIELKEGVTPYHAKAYPVP